MDTFVTEFVTIATPKEDIEMIKRRFKLASEANAEVIAREKKGKRK